MSNSENCQELLNIETISSAFKSNQSKLGDRVISCFYACYLALFIKWAKITYKQYPDDLIEFAANNSFTDGVLKLKESASRNELYQGNASARTVLFHYCKNMLLGNLTAEKRLAEKNRRLTVLHAGEPGYEDRDNERTEDRYKNIMQALEKMSVADRQIIQWRHIEEKSNDEIAQLLAITVASATNRIYRCMQRLRELVQEQERKNK